jgi:uncharacterized repeat protein (TIGR02059 family)
MTLTTDITFNGLRAESTGGDILTTFGSPTTDTFGTDESGNFWQWAQTAPRGAGITLDSDLPNNSVYSLALRFKFSEVSSYRKIVDYSNGSSDTGFYILNGKVNYYPLGTATTPTFSANQLVDLIATRDASNYFRVYVNDGQGGYQRVLEVLDLAGSSKPPLVAGKYRFGFFYDDTATSSEFSSSGKVYSIKAYDTALTPTEVAAVFPDVTPPVFVSATTNSAGTQILLTYGETLSATTAGSSDFAVTVAGAAVAVTSVTVSGSSINLALASTITSGQAATVAYTDPTSANDTNAIQDVLGNDASTLASTAVTNAVVAPSSGGDSGQEVASSNVSPTVDLTPQDTAPAGVNVQSSDGDGDGIREVTIASDGMIVDGNRDGTADWRQTDVAGLRLINDGALASDYGALVVNPGVQLSGVTLTAPTSDGSLPVTASSGGTVVTTTPDGITNAFAGVVSFNVSGLTPGGSTQATINFPSALPAGTGNAYVRFNYSTNRFEEYVDASGNPLYAFVDSDGDGILDAVNLTLVDGDPSWDGDGSANGTVVDPGFLGSGERIITGTKRNDTLTGNILVNTIYGKKGKDWLQGDLGNDILKGSIGNDRLYGGEGADQITGGKDNDRFLYTAATDSTSSLRDTVKFGTEDRFVFTSFDGDSTTEGQQKLSFIGKQAFSGVAGELRATRSVLEADLNGDSLADFAVNLRGRSLITTSNLVL